EDLAVSGTIEETPDTEDTVHAKVTIEGPDRVGGAIDSEWPDRGTDATARIEGTIGGRRVNAHMPAP
ncbi:MAG TPA: hypothetical protein VGL87_03860, partial [Steroidobacteraceae bacterium]